MGRKIIKGGGIITVIQDDSEGDTVARKPRSRSRKQKVEQVEDQTATEDREDIQADEAREEAGGLAQRDR